MKLLSSPSILSMIKGCPNGASIEIKCLPKIVARINMDDLLVCYLHSAMCLPARYPHLSSTRYEGVYRYGSRLMCSMDFDFVLEGLHHEAMLRQQILHLQEYRSHGLTRLAAINVFHEQKGERERQLRHLSMMGETIRDWEAATSSSTASASQNTISFYEDKDSSR